MLITHSLVGLLCVMKVWDLVNWLGRTVAMGKIIKLLTDEEVGE
jgi:hypothetical protein